MIETDARKADKNRGIHFHTSGPLNLQFIDTTNFNYLVLLATIM